MKGADLEYLTKAQAEQQAWRIEKYWLERGHVVRTRIEPISTRGTEHGKLAYVVRSSLVGGLPPTAARRRLVPLRVE